MEDLIPITPAESSILCLFAGNPGMSEAEAASFLSRLSPEVRGIGRALRGDSDVSEQETQAAQGILAWASENSEWVKTHQRR